MKALNLDEIKAPSRSVTIDGITYEVPEMTLETMIENLKEAERIKALEEQGKSREFIVLENLQSSIEFVCRAIPSMPAEVVRGLGYRRLNILMQFIQGLLDTEVETGAEVAAEGKDKAATTDK